MKAAAPKVATSKSIRMGYDSEESLDLDASGMSWHVSNFCRYLEGTLRREKISCFQQADRPDDSPNCARPARQAWLSHPARNLSYRGGVGGPINTTARQAQERAWEMGRRIPEPILEWAADALLPTMVAATRAIPAGFFFLSLLSSADISYCI